MRTKTPLLQLYLLCFTAFFVQSSSNLLPTFPHDPSEKLLPGDDEIQLYPPSIPKKTTFNSFSNQGCELDFNTFPFKPTGACVGAQKGVTCWGGFPTTLCCESALTALSQALAVRGHNNYGGSIFLDEDEWSSCTNHLLQQQTKPANSCSFDNLFHGSSKCSGLDLSFVRERDSYKSAQGNCSDFKSSFVEVCESCSSAIVQARDDMLHFYGAKDNNTERAICGVAIVISLAAGKVDDPSWIDGFYRCLPALDKLEPGYIKLRKSTAKGVFAMLIAIIGLLGVISLVKYVTRNNKPKPAQLKEITTWSGLYRFSKAEIENAINFGNERKSLGRGSAGHVYKGVLPSGQVVAIKHINKSNTSDSFRREVEGLSRVRHPNLVCLFGYCIEDGEQYLVYEYCPAGNLANHLLRKDSLLTWERRVKILRGCALALRYLHHFIDGCIVHRDIKLTNILLTEKLEPKLSDFGLAKMLRMEESKVFTDVRGTIGYMDPEYMSNAKLTCASDIYSFGIVALQLLSGQKVIELDLDARDQLTRKAKDVTMGKRPLSDFEDPRLNGEVNKADFESILQVAVFCVAKSSKDRPTIDMVFDEIEKAWKNTATDKRIKWEMTSTVTSMSISSDVVPL